MSVNRPGRSLFAVCILTALPFLSTQASVFDSPFETTTPYVPTYKEDGFHFLVREGITGGGDSVSNFTFPNGGQRDIRAGGVNQFGMGTRYKMSSIPLAIALSINYHYDYDHNTNDDASFRRVPLEALAYLSLPGNVRIGGGIRYSYSARATSTINGVTERINFHNTRGSIVEIGYHVLPYGWVDLRYVRETYRVESYSSSGTTTQTATGNAPYNGSHVGVFVTFEN